MPADARTELRGVVERASGARLATGLAPIVLIAVWFLAAVRERAGLHE